MAKIKDLLRPQEKRVLMFLAEGHDNRGIAKRMNLSTSTVKNHLNSIYTALDLVGRQDFSPRVAAAVWYVRCVQKEGEL